MSKLAPLTNREIQGRIEEIDSLRGTTGNVTTERRLNMEKARLVRELKRREGVVHDTLPDPTKIPHVFFNVELTKPASKELHKYLSLCLEHYPDSLKYLHRKSQEYVKHGSGVRKMGYEDWKRKLATELRKQKWE